MTRFEHAVSSAARYLCHTGILLAVGCSGAAGSDDGSAEELQGQSIEAYRYDARAAHHETRARARRLPHPDFHRWFPRHPHGHHEQCDDGNTQSGDGCSAPCELETGYICTAPGQPCREPRCGDGFQDSYAVPSSGAGGEPAGAAGSSNTGGGFASGGAAGSTSYVYESCDDGNTTPGDGCDASCNLESGYVYEQPGTPCRQPRCGDGVVDYYYPFVGGTGGAGGAPTSGAGGLSAGAGGAFGGSTASAGAAGAAGGGPVEQCDDGNTQSGDGCSSTCQLE